jgi:hypothetical protein
MHRVRNTILQHTPDKLLPKAKKSKSPRNVVCKVDHPRNKNVVHLVYVKLTNSAAIRQSENHLAKIDYAGVFTTRADAQHVADCLNRLFTLYRIHDQRYRMVPGGQYTVAPFHFHGNVETVYIVLGIYKVIGNIEPNQFVSDYLVGIARNREELNALKATNILHSHEWFESFYFDLAIDSHDTLLYFDGGIYAAKYKMNDVMPTMNLDHYDVQKHKQMFKTVAEGIKKMPHTKRQKSLVEDLKALPHSQDTRRNYRRSARSAGWNSDDSDSDSEDASKFVKTVLRKTPSPPSSQPPIKKKPPIRKKKSIKNFLSPQRLFGRGSGKKS